MPRVGRQSTFRFPLSTLFAGQGAVRVARELFRHGGPLSIRDLSYTAGLTPMGVRLVLEPFLDLGLVRRIGRGRSNLYQAVPEHPLSDGLATLFKAEQARVHEAYEEIRAAAQSVAPAPSAVWLFGSVARGEDHARSDLDLAVCAPEPVVEKTVDGFREALRPVGERLGIAFSVVGVSTGDLDRMEGEQDPFWTSLKTEARTLVGPEPADALRAHRRERGRAARKGTDE